MNGSGNFDMGTFFGGQTFYDVSFTDTTSNVTIRGNNTFRNLTIAGRVASGIRSVSFSGFSNDNQTITGTLTFSAGTDATCRTQLAASRTTTLTCAAVSATDVDFGRITIAGAAAPASGTRLGNLLRNSGITFPAAKTVYWNLAAGGDWGGAVGWATSSGGAPAINNFPLPQDTAIIENTGLNSGATITFNASYTLATIDMSARTSAMTFAIPSTVIVFGNWSNGTGVTFSGTGAIAFAGGGTSTITSAGRTFTQRIYTSDTSVSLQDALITSYSSSFNAAYEQNLGVLTLNNFNITLTGALSKFALGAVSGLTMGSGTLTIAGERGFSASSSFTSVTGTGTISLTSASAKTFEGGGLQTYPTLNQGGTGTLTITGANKFANLTNTAIGRIQFSDNNEFDVFSINGVSGNLLQLGSNTTTQRTLTKSSAWNVGANSIDAGNNTGLSFTAGDNDYLSVSYINGVTSTILASIAESVTATDTQGCAATLNTSTTESAAASDTQAARLIYTCALAESSTVVDAVQAFRAYLASVAESITTSDIPSAFATLRGSVSEALTALDTLRRFKVQAVNLADYTETGAGVSFNVPEVQLIGGERTTILVSYNEIFAEFLGIHYETTQVELLNNNRTTALVSYNEIFAEVLSVPTSVKRS
jgi:hypothetical protein